MSARVVNWSLYVVTFVLMATGVATIGTNRADAAWLYDVHRYTGALLCILLIPKFGIIFRAYIRRFKQGTWNQLNVWAGLVLTLLLLVSAVGALVWTLQLSPFWIQIVLYITPLALHWYVALALVPFFLWHVWVRWVTLPKMARLPRELRESKRTRRQALYLLSVGALGVVGFGALQLAGNTIARRFTGSRIVAQFTGNAFPVTQSDTPPLIDSAQWRLHVSGKVAQPFDLNYAQLLALSSQEQTAALDCTLGWTSIQSWRGVPLAQLLTLAGWDGQSAVTVQAATGTFVGLSAQDVGEALLATHVGTEPLNAEHGFPARLVIPARRGYQWLKWVNEIVVS